jgi:hypothetical protein
MKVTPDMSRRDDLTGREYYSVARYQSAESVTTAIDDVSGADDSHAHDKER